MLFDLQAEFKMLCIRPKGSEDENLLWNKISTILRDEANDPDQLHTVLIHAPNHTMEQEVHEDPTVRYHPATRTRGNSPAATRLGQLNLSAKGGGVGKGRGRPRWQ
ncbi:hypothetical protein CRE_05264 [Caenorhabditis remanei]|uniref:Uncharacterized protein n=1 Tax=Caenorhabditis remanei TaxID=31234 RepID=E3NID8_CAERE|nr:hypothetical protein CRE_05264 [Caenorhabditis remanei]